jgi:hypothetical protein
MTDVLTQWLLPEDLTVPDIIVIGLQEIVRVGHSETDCGPTTLQQISDVLQATLGNPDVGSYGFHLFEATDLLGCCLLAFARYDQIQYITNRQIDCVKLGESKGAAVLRFELSNASFCFINAHLSSGEGQTNTR